jgi:hypothetical protein
MIKLTDIYKAVSGLLKEKYGYKIYGHEVTEGYKKPSFFVDITPNAISNESTFYKKYAYTIIITYFQETADEIDNLTKVDEIQELFGNNLKLNEETSINLSDYDYEFVGINTNILQMSIETEFYDKIPVSDNHEIAENLNLNYNTKG